MKNLKGLCSLILVIVILGATSLTAFAAENYIVLYGFAFDINSDNEAVIHSYDSRSAEVVIPKTLLDADVVMIDDHAFFGDETITSVSFDNAEKLRAIGVSAFHGCTGLGEVAIPLWIKEIGFGAFQNCTGLERLTLQNGIGEIPAQCFYGCTKLGRVILPESVTAIGERAFMNCDSLKTVLIPDATQQIADNAFDGCDDLVIYCNENSYAQEYALAHDIVYVLMNVEPAALIYKLGDADRDGLVSIMDATVIQRKLVELPVGALFLRAADIDGDGLNILDATKIQRYLADYENPYHIGDEIVEPLILE